MAWFKPLIYLVPAAVFALRRSATGASFVCDWSRPLRENEERLSRLPRRRWVSACVIELASSWIGIESLRDSSRDAHAADELRSRGSVSVSAS
jgi:hypothetical protein